MSHDDKLKIQEWINGRPELVSARHNRDYDTMASVLLQETGTKLTPLQMHGCMAEVAKGN